MSFSVHAMLHTRFMLHCPRLCSRLVVNRVHASFTPLYSHGVRIREEKSWGLEYRRCHETPRHASHPPVRVLCSPQQPSLINNGLSSRSESLNNLDVYTRRVCAYADTVNDNDTCELICKCIRACFTSKGTVKQVGCSTPCM